MASSTVQDWIVEIGYDDSKVIKGVKNTEKVLGKLDRIKARTSATAVRGVSKENEALRKQNILDSQRLQLRKKINQAEQLGMKNLKRERGALGGTNPVKIRQQVLDLDKRITVERKKQQEIEARKKASESARKTAELEAKQRASEAAARRKAKEAAQKRVFKLDPSKELDMGFTIDSVVRRAKAGLGETSEEFRRINRQAEILKTRISEVGSRGDLSRLRNDIRLLREQTTASTTAIRQQTRAMDAQKFAAKGAADSIRNLARASVSIFAAFEAGQAIFRVAKDFENLSSTLLLSSGSSAQAESDFKFLIGLSRQLGLSVRDTSKAFAKFAVAAGSAGIESTETRKIFTDLSTSIRATGLSQDRANLAFLAFQQMLAGPVVQAQEMNQIIEQMPQFTGMAKKALAEMGMEVENYREAVATGAVDSRKFVTIVSRMMAQQAKATGAVEKAMNSLTAAQARFRTELELSVVEFSGRGGKQGIVDIFEGLTFLVRSLKPLFQFLGAAVKIAGKNFRTLSRIVGGVNNALSGILTFINRVIGILPGIGEAGSKSAKETVGAFDLVVGVFESIESVIDRILGLFQLMIGFVERIVKFWNNVDFSNFIESSKKARKEALGEFATDFERLGMAGVPLGSQGISSAVPGGSSLGLLSTVAGALLNKDGSKGKVNSDNTMQVTITGVDTNNQEAVRETVTSVLQDTFKVAF